MANLLIDIGSTALKASWAEEVTLGRTFRYQGEKIMDFILSLLQKERAAVIVISSVRELSPANVSELEKYCDTLVLMTPSKVEGYVSPDRMAAIEAAGYLFGGKSCTIFDFGTTMTVDFIDEKGKFISGNVSIGCRTRYKALARYSKSYPLQDTPEDLPRSVNDIASSIDTGILNGMIFEIEGYIARHSGNIVVFTGGDAIYFAKKMKSPIFVVSNLVLMGLALIARKYEH